MGQNGPSRASLPAISVDAVRTFLPPWEGFFAPRLPSPAPMRGTVRAVEPGQPRFSPKHLALFPSFVLLTLPACPWECGLGRLAP